MEDYNKVEVLLANDSFVRWIEGKASRIEVSDWESWLEEDPARKKLKEEAVQVHQSFGFKKSNQSDIEHEISKLNNSINKFEKSKTAATIRQKIGNQSKRSYYSLVAAIGLLLIVTLGSLYFLYEPTEPVQKKASSFLTRSTDYGEKRVLTLTDGSTVVLNSNSNLKLPESHTGDLELWLNGEAYFDIAHNTEAQKRTVTVHTQDGHVQVLGTEFNINTFKEGTEVVLDEGSIKIGVLNGDGEITSTQKMEPGELSQFVVNRKRIHTKRIKSELYTSWTEDKLIFDHTLLANVAERIEHIYGVELEMMNPKLGKTKISGSIPNNNLPIFLDALGKILQQPISRNNGRITVGSAGK